MKALVSRMPLDPGLHLYKWWRHTLALSGVLLILSVVLLGVRGLNFGVDFRGGVQLEVQALSGTVDLDSLREQVAQVVDGAVVQSFGGDAEALINLPLVVASQAIVQQSASTESASTESASTESASTESTSTEEAGTEEAGTEASANTEAPSTEAATADNSLGALAEVSQLKTLLESEYTFRRTEFVGPKVGGELRRAGLIATLFSLLVIALYVWFRFEWQFAIAAFLTLLHDVIATLGFYALTGIEFNLTTLAAILAIAGYSINDTVVIFDRVREILRRDRKHDVAYAMDEAPNRTLSRSLLTSLTTLLATLMLFFFAGPLVQGLAAGLIFGVVLGTWSSIGLAIPLVRLMRFSRSQLDEAEAA